MKNFFSFFITVLLLSACSNNAADIISNNTDSSVLFKMRFDNPNPSFNMTRIFQKNFINGQKGYKITDSAQTYTSVANFRYNSNNRLSAIEYAEHGAVVAKYEFIWDGSYVQRIRGMEDNNVIMDRSYSYQLLGVDTLQTSFTITRPVSSFLHDSKQIILHTSYINRGKVYAEYASHDFWNGPNPIPDYAGGRGIEKIYSYNGNNLASIHTFGITTYSEHLQNISVEEELSFCRFTRNNNFIDPLKQLSEEILGKELQVLGLENFDTVKTVFSVFDYTLDDAGYSYLNSHISDYFLQKNPYYLSYSQIAEQAVHDYTIIQDGITLENNSNVQYFNREYIADAQNRLKTIRYFYPHIGQWGQTTIEYP